MFLEDNRILDNEKNIANGIINALINMEIDFQEKGATVAGGMRALFITLLQRPILKSTIYPFTNDISSVFNGDLGIGNLNAKFIEDLMKASKVESINNVEDLKSQAFAIFNLIYDALFDAHGEMHPAVKRLFETIQKSNPLNVGKPSAKALFQAMLTLFTIHFSNKKDSDLYLNFVMLGQSKLEQQSTFSRSTLQSVIDKEFNAYVENYKQDPDQYYYFDKFFSRCYSEIVKNPTPLQSFKDASSLDVQKQEKSKPDSDLKNLIKDVVKLRLHRENNPKALQTEKIALENQIKEIGEKQDKEKKEEKMIKQWQENINSLRDENNLNPDIKVCGEAERLRYERVFSDAVKLHQRPPTFAVWKSYTKYLSDKYLSNAEKKVKPVREPAILIPQRMVDFNCCASLKPFIEKRKYLKPNSQPIEKNIWEIFRAVNNLLVLGELNSDNENDLKEKVARIVDSKLTDDSEEFLRECEKFFNVVFDDQNDYKLDHSQLKSLTTNLIHDLCEELKAYIYDQLLFHILRATESEARARRPR